MIIPRTTQVLSYNGASTIPAQNENAGFIRALISPCQMISLIINDIRTLQWMGMANLPLSSFASMLLHYHNHYYWNLRLPFHRMFIAFLFQFGRCFPDVSPLIKTHTYYFEARCDINVGFSHETPVSQKDTVKISGAIASSKLKHTEITSVILRRQHDFTMYRVFISTTRVKIEMVPRCVVVATME
jgi:hypothetical protein